jgi:hypothetical protein
MEKEPSEPKSADPKEAQDLNEQMGSDEMMKRICMYCEKFLGYKKGKGVSHGMCQRCFKKHFPEIYEASQKKQREA